MSGLRAEVLVRALRADRVNRPSQTIRNSKLYTLDPSHAKTIHNLCIETNNLPRGTAGLQKPRVQEKWQSNETLIGISTFTPTRAKIMWYTSSGSVCSHVSKLLCRFRWRMYGEHIGKLMCKKLTIEQDDEHITITAVSYE